jgi:uroporphyrinogen decarboxylase
MLQVFDSWAGELSPSQYREFALPCLKKIAEQVKHQLGKDAVPMTLFAKGYHCLEELVGLGYDTLSIDWTLEPSVAIKKTKGKINLQGNLDPCALYGNSECIRRHTKEMIKGFSWNGKGLIANLGHGMYPDMNPESLKQYLEAIKEFKV